MYYVCIILLLLRLNAVKNLFYCTECFLLPLGKNLIIVPTNYGQCEVDEVKICISVIYELEGVLP